MRLGGFGLTLRQGVDDVIAMLLAFSAKPEELDILMLSLTFGNVDVQRHVPILPFTRLILSNGAYKISVT